MPITTTPTAGAPRGFALWNLGFRPFYLAAGMFAVLALALWTAQFAGWLAGAAYMRDPLWHAHEMIFGYAFAVIAGFLFTAVRNWTSLPTPTGRTLAAIVALWVAARVLLAISWPSLAAAADTAFALALATGIGVPLLRSGNRRNYFFIALLLAIGGANLAFYLAMSVRLDIPVRDMLQSASTSSHSSWHLWAGASFRCLPPTGSRGRSRCGGCGSNASPSRACSRSWPRTWPACHQ